MRIIPVGTDRLPLPVLTEATAAAAVFAVMTTVERDIHRWQIADVGREDFVSGEFIHTSNRRIAYDSSDRSYHRFGLAWDFDFQWDIDQDGTVEMATDTELKAIQPHIASRLGDNFDVIVHRSDRGGWHIHIEWDPRPTA